jgi:hypothetical protein
MTHSYRSFPCLQPGMIVCSIAVRVSSPQQKTYPLIFVGVIKEELHLHQALVFYLASVELSRSFEMVP